MALIYTIKTFEVDDNESSKTRVGFKVTDDATEEVFLIDKLVTTASKSDNAITQEAYTAAQSEVNAWVSSRSNIGKTWNPDTNAME